MAGFWNTIIPAVVGGLNVANTWNQTQGRNDYQKQVQKSIDEQNANALNKYNYDIAYNKQVQDYNAKEAGSNRAASAANAAAARAARLQAQKILDRAYGNIEKQWKPYAEMSGRLTQGMEGIYNQGLKGADLLSQYLMAPGMMGRISGNAPSAAPNIQLPSFLRGAK